MPFIGFDWRYRKMEKDAMGMVEGEKNLFGQTNTKDNRQQFSAGVAYTLPMLVILQTEIYHDGKCKGTINERRYSNCKTPTNEFYAQHRQGVYGRF